MARESLTEHSSTQARPAGSSSQLGKLIFLCVVIVAAISWLVYLLTATSPGTAVTSTEGQIKVGLVLKAISSGDDRKFEYVHASLEGEEPNQTVVVTGRVKTKALLEELTGAIRAVPGGEAVKIEVAVKP